MKKITTLLAWLICLPLFAQQPTTEQKASALTEKMQQQIGFNEATKSKVQAINLDFLAKTGSIKASDNSRREKFKSLKQADDQRAAALKKVLTDKEYALFEKFRKENREKAMERYKESR